MKKCLFALLGLFIAACGNSDFGPKCTTEDDCMNNSKCECWCSRKCGFRSKKPDDSPIYMKDDPNGKNCYCKQWDYDYYEENCVEGKKMPQPAGAQ